MKQIGGKSGAVIEKYDDETGEKMTFSFFYFFNGSINMTIRKKSLEEEFMFKSEEDFRNRAEASGLPKCFIETAILASQI